MEIILKIHLHPNNMSRRLDILRRASTIGCLVNAKWAFALVDEPAMKWLRKNNYVMIKRHPQSIRKNITLAFATPAGLEYLENHEHIVK